jgi:uncharacterized damage-inducible protein DinB
MQGDLVGLAPQEVARVNGPVITPIGLQPPAGMSREVGLLFAQLEFARRRTRELVTGMSEEQLDARDEGVPNSIGQLLFHIAGVEIYLIHRMILAEGLSDALVRAYAPLRLDSDASRALAARDLGFYLSRLDEVRARTEAACWKLTDDDLERVCIHPEDGARWTVRYTLAHLADHEAEHRGQIAMRRRQVGAAR